jgi:hypothetical protein
MEDPRLDEYATPYDWAADYGPADLRAALEHREAADDYHGAPAPVDWDELVDEMGGLPPTKTISDRELLAPLLDERTT